MSSIFSGRISLKVFFHISPVIVRYRDNAPRSIVFTVLLFPISAAIFETSSILAEKPFFFIVSLTSTGYFIEPEDTVEGGISISGIIKTAVGDA